MGKGNFFDKKTDNVKKMHTVIPEISKIRLPVFSDSSHIDTV